MKDIEKFGRGNLEDKLEIEGINSNGYGIMPKIVMQDPRLTIESKAIYAYIVSYAGAGNTAFPSLKKILTDLKIGDKRFYKHRKLLIECNYITVTAIRNEKKEIIKNIYTLISNPKMNPEEGTSQNDVYPISQNDVYPISQNDRHIINKTKINSIKINNKKEGSQSSPSFLSDDDEYINTNKQLTPSDTEIITDSTVVRSHKVLMAYLNEKEYLKPLAINFILAGIKEKDILAIIQFLCTLPKIDQEVSELVNAQIRANEREAKTNGLTNYKAYFIKGLKLKLENANYNVVETEITDPKLIAAIPKVTLHDWLNGN